MSTGYPIEQLASQGDFYDSAFLLLHGELPDRQEKAAFRHDITTHSLVHEQLIQFYRGFRHDAHPMAIMCGVVGALSAFYPEVAKVDDPQQRLRAWWVPPPSAQTAPGVVVHGSRQRGTEQRVTLPSQAWKTAPF
jgi:citrate synthase